MLFLCKSSCFSRSIKVEDEHDDPQQNHEKKDATTSLTVWRKSLLFSCKGFTVISNHGNLVYRVDSYTGRPDHLTLMDAAGKPIHTMRRHKKFGLVDSWLMYQGEDDQGKKNISKKPIFVVKKYTSIFRRTDLDTSAYIYRSTSTSASKRYSYVVKGSYTSRSCKVLNEAGQVVAEIKRKEAATRGASFGLEVFQLVVTAEFDAGFAMAIVLLLDQLFS